MKIAVVGGGPGGLYFSMLMKRRRPAFAIDVFEQNPPTSTFGFGIAIHGSSWSFLREDNPDCLADIVAASTLFHGQRITHKGEGIEFPVKAATAGIRRLTLLEVFRRHATRAGACIVQGERVEDLTRFDGYDLVVGADGVNSVVRASHEAEFGVTKCVLTSRMAWYGANRPTERSQLTFRKTRYGYFWSVSYPHSPGPANDHASGTSTFVGECEAAAYEASGMDRMSLEEQAEFSARIYEEELGGQRLLFNPSSTWRALPVIRVKRWHVGNRVLIGDALHSPHPSIGSGTRLSLSDAAALAGALDEHPDEIERALTRYRAVREPSKQKLVEAMERSLEWYERIGERADGLSPLQLVYDYMARTGRMSVERMREYAPEFLEKYGPPPA